MHNEQDFLREEDLEFSFFRSHGPGGQKKNTTDSAVRLRHIPTGIIVIQTGSRSQFRNKEAALIELKRRLEARRHRQAPRIATRPTRSSVSKRLQEKQLRGKLKQSRMRPGDE